MRTIFTGTFGKYHKVSIEIEGRQLYQAITKPYNTNGLLSLSYFVYPRLIQRIPIIGRFFKSFEIRLAVTLTAAQYEHLNQLDTWTNSSKP